MPNANTYGSLVLGWSVTSTLEPQYWINTRDPKPGSQADSDLVVVPADALGSHTAIIAQSGSGKSYFLGRLVEEVMLESRARCVILDPNADFRRIHEVENPLLWTAAAYQLSARRGKLPHEASRDEFASQWSNVSIRIRGGGNLTGDKSEQLRLWWPTFDVQFLAEDVDAMYRSDLYHCHSFVRMLGRLLEFKLWATGKSTDLIDSAQRLFRQARALEKRDLVDALNQEYNSIQLIGRNLEDEKGSGEDFIPLGTNMIFKREILLEQIRRFIEAALTVSDYVSPTIERFYFGKAREYEAGGILQTEPPISPLAGQRHNRIEVIDLPSLPENMRLMAINSLLTTEWLEARRAWERALQEPSEQDDRVPVFIVIDEAHNLIPNEPRTKSEAALREQFRTLAAEGRKYGLFLVLVSQRPDKLDSLVLSEVENKAIMKLGSTSVLNITKQMLGLDEVSPMLLNRCLEFETGRALLVGRWVPSGPITLFSAARRTVEGGRSLRVEHWAKRPETVSDKKAGSKRKRTVKRKSKGSKK